MTKEVLIRPYKEKDRFSVREISWETAFKGEAAQVFFGDREFLSDLLTLYFTDYEPESCFVAEDTEHKIVGYIVGAKDLRRLKNISLTRLAGRLFIRAIRRGVFFNRKSLAFLFSCGMSFLKGEFIVPDFSQDYPATLHINVRSGSRGLKVGSQLMNAFLEYLKKENMRGVHLATASDNARRFFEEHGFVLLHERRRSYFRYLLGRDIAVYILGRKISKAGSNPERKGLV